MKRAILPLISAAAPSCSPATCTGRPSSAYKAGLKEYFLGLGAGHYRLEISDEKVLARFYPGAATEPARTFDLTPGKPLRGSDE